MRNPDYYHKGQPFLDGFKGIYAPKQATQIDAIRSDRAAAEFRGYPPSAMNQLKQELGDQIKILESDWNCGSRLDINHKKKPFDDPRVRRALSLAIDRWGSAPALSEVADVKTVGTIVFPGSPLAPTKEEMKEIPGLWPDIEKSRAEARRLLKEAGVENLKIELLNRNVDQPYKYVGIWVIDQWHKIGVNATQRVVPTGPWFAAQRSGDFEVNVGANCHDVVNPVIDIQPYLPNSYYPAQYGNFEDPKEVELYEKVLHETDPDKTAPGDAGACRGTGDRGARPVPVVVVSPGAAAQLRARLEDQPEPLHQPGPRHNLVERAEMRRMQRLGPGSRKTCGSDEVKQQLGPSRVCTGGNRFCEPTVSSSAAAEMTEPRIRS